MSLNSHQRIKLLPEHLIDQIKAGEVVERPASLLKELIENAVDAGSTQINIHLVNNGLELLAIEDNGKGMYQEELPYAFARHATSKITRFEDIYNLASFGFRGEALASAASISRLTCTSAPRDDLEAGGKIVLHGGQTIEDLPFKGNSAGTSFFIRDLFFNTPARLKFIKSKTSEKNALKRIFHSALLSHPEIEFSIKWDDGEKKRYQSSDLKTRVREVLIGKKSDPSELLSFEGQFDRTKIIGFLPTDPSLGSRSSQYLFANHRLFTDKALHQVIMQSMARVWEGASAAYAVFIEVAPDEVDVNVHPNKTQIKFFKMGEVVGVLKESIKRALPTPAPKSIEVENPSQDILNDFEFSYPQTSLKGHQSASHTTTTSALQAIGTSYLLMQGDKLISVERTLTALSHELLRYKEEDAIPLLIATPHPRPSNWSSESEEYFRLRGFEWEELSEERIALKTLPAALGPYPTHIIATYLLKDFGVAQDSEEIRELVCTYLEQTPLEEVPKNCYIEIDDQLLAKLFND